MVEAVTDLAYVRRHRFVIPKFLQGWRLNEQLVLSLALVALALVLDTSEYLWEWDQVVYDLQIQYWTRAPADDVVIIAIDEQSLDELGRWPWARSNHVELLERLTRASARVIGLDVMFAEPDTNAAEYDQRLANAVRDSGRVVLPVVNGQTRLGGQLIEILPIPELSSAAAKLGHVDRQLDLDAIARSAYLRAGLGDPHWPSFALAMLELAGSDSWNELPGLRNPASTNASPYSWTRDYQIWVAYAGPPGHFPRVSYVDVLRDRVSADLFTDKFVFVGATAAGLGDLLPTPVSGDRQPMPGVEIVANEFDTLRWGLAILPLATPWRMVLTVLLVLAPMLLYPRVPRWSLAVWIGIVLATLVVSVGLLRGFRFWYPPVEAMLVVTIGYVLWSWRRLVQTVRYLNQELLRLHEERTITRRHEQPDVTRMVEFLSQIMPIGGCVLMDDADRVNASWGEPPRVFVEPPQIGQWSVQLPAIWTALRRRGEVWRLGIHWNGESRPAAGEQRLLVSLAVNCEFPDAKTPRSPVEFVQSRIQQVQAATERLQSLRQFITDTLAQLAHGVVVSDAVGRVLMGNSRAKDYMAMAQEEEFEHSLTELLARLEVTSEDTMSQVLQRVLLDGETVQVAARAPGGQDLLVQVSPFDYEQDDLSGVLVNLADVSDLRESERRRRALMAFLSHDLRTPLASILAVIDIAKLKPEKLEDPKYIENIEHNARRTLKLADDFLYLTRAESAESTAFSDMDLVKVALNACDAVEAQATAKQIRLTKELPPAATLVGDAALLERALTNLLSNAVKYSPKRAQVTLGIELVDGQLHCWVKDTGYGIAEQDRPNLFARFKRIERQEHQHEYGSGLGLAFVKTVIERHHGTIELESHVGEGSCFHIYLPHTQLFH